MSGNKLSKEARTRIDTMCNTNDGFEIAEVDLKLRGPGDMEGTQQSGLPISFKLANLGKDNQLITLTRNTAMEILENDPELQLADNLLLKKQLSRMKTKGVDLSVVS